MTITEVQQRIIEAQKRFVEEQSELLAAMSAGTGLTPDQEAELALYLGEFDTLSEKLRIFINKILHQPG